MQLCKGNPSFISVWFYHLKSSKMVRYLVKSSVILLPVLGCTWIFGLLSVNQYTLVFTWLFTILNSLQVSAYILHILHSAWLYQCFSQKGFFIFICYVLRHEKVMYTVNHYLSILFIKIHLPLGMGQDK